MRRLALAAIPVLTLLLVAPSAAGAHVRPGKHASCPAVKHALVGDAQAEVYEAVGSVEREMFACAYASGHAYPLGPKPEPGTPSGGGGVEKVTLSGSVVGYEEFVIRTEVSSRWTVIVRNLRTGRVVHNVPSGPSNSSDEVGEGFVTSLVLKSDGAVAWIVAGGLARDGNQVHIVDASGSRIVASGTDVEQSSLALAGSTLYWTQGGKPETAVLN